MNDPWNDDKWEERETKSINLDSRTHAYMLNEFDTEWNTEINKSILIKCPVCPGYLENEESKTQCVLCRREFNINAKKD